MRVTSVQGLMHSYASLTGYIVHLGTEGVHLCCLVKMYLSALITLIGFLTVKQRRSQTAGALIKKKNRKSQMHRRTSEASTRDCTLFPENRTTFETPEHIKESLCLGSEWLPGKGEDVGTCSMENAGKCSGPIRLDE